MYPITEEIRLQTFAFPDRSLFLIDLLSDGDSVYSRDNSLKILGSPVKMCSMCTGTTVQSCRSTPEPIRKVHQKPFFHIFIEPQVVRWLNKKKHFLSRLNPNVENYHGWDFDVILACFKHLGWAGSTQIFGKRTGLSRLNPNFWKKYQWACGGKGL